MPWLWSDALQMLHSAGHPPDQVDEYTLDKVAAYSQAIDRARRRRHIELALLLRLAPNLPAKEFAEYLKE